MHSCVGKPTRLNRVLAGGATMDARRALVAALSSISLLRPCAAEIDCAVLTLGRHNARASLDPAEHRWCYELDRAVSAHFCCRTECSTRRNTRCKSRRAVWKPD